jgi:aspartyl-tRNA synthetase
MLRTHTCGELNIKDVDKEVVLCGWVHRIRSHGKLVFLDLRDRSGLIQIVFNPKENEKLHKIAQTLKSEYVLRIKGQVRKRPQGTENPKISTGDIEINVKDLEILNKSLRLPFEIADQIDASEEIRFKYRYLDFRRKKVYELLILRHNLYRVIRDFLEKEGFIEVETPFLTKSTPEGARDYLIPSRLNKGNFFALPQSPQLFKQILMIGGIDRYYQIVRCFRDEDLRKDRQPEFTQLDLEMTFIDEADIFSLIERLMREIFLKLKGIEIQIPFLRLTFSEAQNKYKTDKPDLRKDKKDFSFVWIKDFPLFKYNEEEKHLDCEHHPFTQPRQEDLEFLKKDPLKVRARSYDLILNGQEIGSGSIRIHDRKLQEEIFSLIGISKKEAQQRFGFLLRALNYGAPPMGGIALGIDRFLSILADLPTIRETIAFPKTQKAVCLLTGAPSGVNKRQLDELGIKLGGE